MFKVNKEDFTIICTRGDVGTFTFGFKVNGERYTFRNGDVVRFKVCEKKNNENVVLIKDFNNIEGFDTVEINLNSEETKFGEVINKPADYWYEIELNPDTKYNQTIIGYDEEKGAKIFRLLPEGGDVK